METIILTGFEPFGSYSHNPTQQSTLDFHGKIFGDRKVIGLVLPCTYDAWGQLASLIQRTNADKVISTGLSSSVKGIRIESKFHNVMNGKYPDAKGFDPKNIPVMEEDAPISVRSKAAHKKLFDLLIKKGIPAELSTNADAFICNALGYKTSLGTRNHRYNTRNLFIHVPWTTAYKDKVSIEEGKIFLDQNVYYKGLELLIKNI
ncbi:hypothetical protein COB64_02390 [Candidatus Wolfebacteria bacterium]|nr:MAG: hypothetical protein COB64_02390 [Candidatus Wolfebacteria bacterium]